MIATAILSIGLAQLATAQAAPADSAAIRRAVQLVWTTVDPKAYGPLYASNAISLEPDGQVVRGRDALLTELADDLATFKGYRVDSVTIGSMRFLGPEHVVVEGGWRVIGPRPPIWHYVFVGVLTRRAGQWQIEAASHIRVGGCC
jgi:hypothetical protein